MSITATFIQVDEAEVPGSAEFEANAASRFDPERMSELRVYPGWRASDVNDVMDGTRRFRDFYADAAARGRAIITCLV